MYGFITSPSTLISYLSTAVLNAAKSTKLVLSQMLMQTPQLQSLVNDSWLTDLSPARKRGVVLSNFLTALIMR